MHTHPNARLTPLGRERLPRRYTEDHLPLPTLDAEAVINIRSAYKLLARYRSGGAAVLVDRRSVRRSQRRALDLPVQHRAMDLRHERSTLRRVDRGLSRSSLHCGPGGPRTFQRCKSRGPIALIRG